MTNPTLFTFGKLSLILLSAIVTVACAVSADAKEQSKVDLALLELQDEFRLYKEEHQDSGRFEATNALLRIVDESVLIDAIAAESAAELESDLRLLGATHLSSYGRIVSCFFPIDRISELPGLISLKFVRPAYATTRPATK